MRMVTKVNLFFLFVCSLILCSCLDVKAKAVCEVVDKSIDHIDVGTEIKCGTENFYILGLNDNKYTLFSKYNLEIGYNCDSSTNCTSMNNPSGIQSKSCSNNSCLPGNTSALKANDISFINAKNNYKNYLATKVGLTNPDVINVTIDYLNWLGCNISYKLVSGTDGHQYEISGTCANSGKSWLYNQSYNIDEVVGSAQSAVPFILDTSGQVKANTVVLNSGVRVLVIIDEDEINLENIKPYNNDNNNDNKKQTVNVGNTAKSIYVLYIIGLVILVLGVIIFIRSYRLNSNEK